MTPAVLLLLAGLAPEPLADTLFARGFYPEAALEYKRALFAGPDSGGLTRLKLGLSLAAGAESERNKDGRPTAEAVAGAADAKPAGPLAELRHVQEENPGLGLASGLARAGFLVRESRLDAARLELLDLLLFAQDSVERQRLYSGLAWLELTGRDPAQAAASCEKAAEPGLAAEIRAASRIQGRSPTLALLLSTFVPGAGEVYAGRPLAGIASFAVTGGSGAAAYLAARSGDWVSAAVVFSLLFLRFYNGSRSNALDFCADYREAELGRRLSAITGARRLEPDWFGPAERLTGLSLALPERKSPQAPAPTERE